MKTSLGAIGIKNKYISRVGRRVCPYTHMCVSVCVIIAELKRNKEFNYNALFVTGCSSRLRTFKDMRAELSSCKNNPIKLNKFCITQCSGELEI